MRVVEGRVEVGTSRKCLMQREVGVDYHKVMIESRSVGMIGGRLVVAWNDNWVGRSRND